MLKQTRMIACLLVFVLTVSWAGAVDINGKGAGLFLNTPHTWGGSSVVNVQNARLISMDTFDGGGEDVAVPDQRDRVLGRDHLVEGHILLPCRLGP